MLKNLNKFSFTAPSTNNFEMLFIIVALLSSAIAIPMPGGYGGYGGGYGGGYAPVPIVQEQVVDVLSPNPFDGPMFSPFVDEYVPITQPVVVPGYAPVGYGGGYGGGGYGDYDQY